MKCWNIESSSHSFLKSAVAHSLNVVAIDVNLDGTKVATGSRDYSVKVWDADSFTSINEFKAPRNVVTCMRFDSELGSLLYQAFSFYTYFNHIVIIDCLFPFFSPFHRAAKTW